MKEKDYGIIISKLDYSESSYILKIYTSREGMSSYLFKGAKKKKDQFKIFPLAIVELEYFKSPKSDLAVLTGIDTYVNTKNNYFDPIKSSIVFFLNEILQKSLRTHESDVELLSFIISRLKFLDLTERPINFHLFFLLDLSKYLGFYPKVNSNEKGECIFDLQEGVFLNSKPFHEDYVKNEESLALKTLLGTKFDTDEAPDLLGTRRIRLLEIITEYYKLHIEDFGECKTLEVLETIFND